MKKIISIENDQEKGHVLIDIIKSAGESETLACVVENLENIRVKNRRTKKR